MAIVMPDANLQQMEYITDGEDERFGPLENTLPRPHVFEVMRIAAHVQFEESARVELPRGMHLKITPDSLDLRAPLPRATCASVQQTGGGQTSMRMCLSAFLCAHGITYFDPLRQAHDPASLMPESTKREVSAACATRRTSHRVMLGSGPHGSQTPRSIALTLLLPRSSRSNKNLQDMLLLDGYAAIAQVKRTVGDSNNVTAQEPHQVQRDPEYSITNTVRFNLLCGEDDVSEFLKHVETIDGNTIGKDWDKTPAFCVSFVKNAQAVCNVYAAIDDSVVASAHAAICALQRALARVQMQCKGHLVLPIACMEVVHVDVEDASFLSMQRRLQYAFHKLFCPDPDLSITEEVMSMLRLFNKGPDDSHTAACTRSHDCLRTQQRDRLVRISPPIQDMNGCIAAAAPQHHMLGMLLCSDMERIQDYVRRCRMLVPRTAFHGEWPVFGLHPTIEDERFANVTVVYAKPEMAHIGRWLNLYCPRRGCEERVTEYEHCNVVRLKCVAEPIDTTLQRGLMVLPCTAASTIPIVPNASVVTSAFIRLMSEMRASVLNPTRAETQVLTLRHHNSDDGTAPTSSASTSATESTHPRATGYHPFEGDTSCVHLFGSQLGHPCVTVGDAYEVLQQNADAYNCSSAGFYSVVNTAYQKFGRETPLKHVMDACARTMQTLRTLDDMVDSLSIDGPRGDKHGIPASSESNSDWSRSPRKRVRTPDDGDSVDKDATNEHHGATLPTPFGMAPLLGAMETRITFPMLRDHTMSLRRILAHLLGTTTCDDLTEKDSRRLHKRVVSVTDANPIRRASLTIASVLNYLRSLINDGRLDAFEVIIVYNTNTDGVASSAMYAAALNNVPITLEPVHTTWLFQERSPALQPLFVQMHSEDLDGEVHVQTYTSSSGR
jgi:hypothetical protein